MRRGYWEYCSRFDVEVFKITLEPVFRGLIGFGDNEVTPLKAVPSAVPTTTTTTTISATTTIPPVIPEHACAVAPSL